MTTPEPPPGPPQPTDPQWLAKWVAYQEWCVKEHMAELLQRPGLGRAIMGGIMHDGLLSVEPETKAMLWDGNSDEALEAYCRRIHAPTRTGKFTPWPIKCGSLTLPGRSATNSTAGP